MNKLGYLHLRPGLPLPLLRDTSPFKAVLVVEDDADDGWQSLVCEWLLRGGCRYVMAWGRDCEAWHDGVDSANLSAFDFKVLDDALVMTTWHKEESLADTFWFCEHCTSHPTLELGRSMIIHIAPEDRRMALLEAFQAAQTISD